MCSVEKWAKMPFQCLFFSVLVDPARSTHALVFDFFFVCRLYTYVVCLEFCERYIIHMCFLHEWVCIKHSIYLIFRGHYGQSVDVSVFSRYSYGMEVFNLWDVLHNTIKMCVQTILACFWTRGLYMPMFWTHQILACTCPGLVSHTSFQHSFLWPPTLLKW